MSKDETKTKEILSEMREVLGTHSEPSEQPSDPLDTGAGSKPPWFIEFENRLWKQLGDVLFDYEEKLIKEQEKRHQELREKQRGIADQVRKAREELRSLKEIAYRSSETLSKLFAIVKGGDNVGALRDQLVKQHRKAAHELQHPELEESNGDAGSP